MGIRPWLWPSMWGIWGAWGIAMMLRLAVSNSIALKFGDDFFGVIPSPT